MSVIHKASVEIGLPANIISSIIRSAPFRYKVFRIPKRNGGERVVAQPSKELKVIQSWLVNAELNHLPLHKAAVAYRRGQGIKENAINHVGNNYLLKMDFSDFFPSIRPSDLEMHLRKYSEGKYSDEDISFITRALFWARIPGMQKELCIGSPGSPFISNTIMYDFDLIISAYCEEVNVVYTRYADDLCFSTSTPNVLQQVNGRVVSCLRELAYPRLGVNDHKTVSTSKKHGRFVTGVTLTSDNQLSIGRERKRLIRSMINRYINQQLTDEESLNLKGLLAFANNIEPEFLHRMEKKYSFEVIEAIRKYIQKENN